MCKPCIYGLKSCKTEIQNLFMLKYKVIQGRTSENLWAQVQHTAFDSHWLYNSLCWHVDFAKRADVICLSTNRKQRGHTWTIGGQSSSSSATHSCNEEWWRGTVAKTSHKERGGGGEDSHNDGRCRRSLVFSGEVDLHRCVEWVVECTNDKSWLIHFLYQFLTYWFTSICQYLIPLESQGVDYSS